jgi:triosephosphate isomerase
MKLRSLRTPLTIINFKTYKAATGKKAEKVAKKLSAAAKRAKKELVIAVQAADIYRVARLCNAKVFAQHIDCSGCGQFTGAVTAEAVKSAGATGTLINHSEKKLDSRTLRKTVVAAKSAGLVTVICAATPKKAAELARLRPDFIAIEPPALIGSGIAVSEAKLGVITSTIRRVSVPVLCGAGIHKKEDVKRAYELGVSGILVASGVVNAKNPAKALKALLSGYK